MLFLRILLSAADRGWGGCMYTLISLSIKLREINSGGSDTWVWDPGDLGSSLFSVCKQACDFGQVPLHLKTSEDASEKPSPWTSSTCTIL